MRLLIFGGNGFIGKNLTRELSKSHEILSTDIKISHLNKIKKLDIMNKESVFKLIEDFNPDVIINLSAKTDIDNKKLENYSVNWQGPLNICNSIIELNRNIFFIHFSTMLVCKMGHTPKNLSEFNPDTTYGESKVKAEEALKNFRNNFPILILRPTTVWGKDAGRPYSTFIKIVSRFGWLRLSFFDAKRDFCHIDNLVFLISRIVKIKNKLEAGYFKIFYISDKKKQSVNDIALRLSTEYNSPFISLPSIDFLIKIFLYILAFIGDLLGFLGFQFILNSRRIRNMKINTDLPVIDLFEELNKIENK